MWKRRVFCTFLGPNGSGKTSLLDYWRRLRPREPLVERTGARWWEFTMIIEALDDELNSWDGKRTRIITNDIIERVKARLTTGQRA
jgi:hypothetical protein